MESTEIERQDREHDGNLFFLGNSVSSLNPSGFKVQFTRLIANNQTLTIKVIP